MPRMRTLACLIVAIAIAGCGSNTTTMPDMPMSVGPDMALNSACGHPGDKGNSKHVGQFCMTLGDCPSGTTCSVLANSTLPPNEQTYYCTIQCDKSAQGTPDVSVCGENSICLCASLGCGCAPIACAPAGMPG
jgi:hypothetical protein